jgi:hypothetical protein
VVVAVIFVRPVEPAFDQVVDMVSVRHSLMSAARAVGVGRVASCRIGVVPRMRLIDIDHVLVDVIAVRMMQMAVM